jgi:hypothetical protein
MHEHEPTTLLHSELLLSSTGRGLLLRSVITPIGVQDLVISPYVTWPSGRVKMSEQNDQAGNSTLGSMDYIPSLS